MCFLIVHCAPAHLSLCWNLLFFEQQSLLPGNCYFEGHMAYSGPGSLADLEIDLVLSDMCRRD